MAKQARFFLVIYFVLLSSLSLAADNIGLNPNAATDFQQAQYRANQRIAQYEAALERGNPTEIRRAALELQKDPLAVRQVNNVKGDSFKVRLNQEISAVQTHTKANIRRQLARRYNVPESQVTFFEATNPSAEIKVGQDWDVTAQVKGKDVPLNVAQEVAHRSFYEAATGKKAPTLEAARHFSESQSVEVTNRSHAEAYGGGGKQLVYNRATGHYEVMTEGGAIIVGDKSTPLRDPQQLTQVMEHKSHLGKNMAAEVRAAGETYITKNNLTGQSAEQVRSMANADAQAWELEQARQYTKQYGRQVEPRVTARGGEVHGQVVKGTKILDRVAKGEISPAEGRAQLKAMGETPESIIQKGSSQIEAAQKLGDSPQDIINRAKTGKSPQDVFTQNVKDSIDLKRTEARAGQPKSLLDGGKSSFQGDSPPSNQPGSSLEQVRAKAEASIQSEKLRTGQSINRPKSLLDGGKSSVGTAETPVVKGSELAEAANANKGLVKSGSQKPASLPGRQAAGAAAEVAAVEAAAEAAGTGEAVKTKIRGPSAQSTNPGGQLEAMGIPDRRPTLTPEQAGVKMPGKAEALSPEALNKTKWVKDPDLARLSNPPGQDLAKAPEGHRGLGEHANGKGQAIDSGKMKTGAQQAAGPGKLATPELQEMARTGKRPASLLDGGKASAQQTSMGKVRSQIQVAEARLGQLAEADIARANQVANKAGVTITSELAADAGILRRGINATGNAAMGGLAAAGAAYEGGTIGYGTGKTMVNLKDAYYEEDEEMREHLIERAKEELTDTAEHAALTTVVVGTTLVAPATAGSALAGAAGYGAGRLVLENTETGRAVDKSVQDGMTDFLTDLDDVARHASGKKTRSTINRETLSRRQQIWLDALERGDIKLQEGATVEDFLTLVQRQHDDGKISKLDNLGALGDAVVKVDKTQTAQPIREDTTFRDPDMEGEVVKVFRDPNLEEGAVKVFRDPNLDGGAVKVFRDPNLEGGAVKVFRDPDMEGETEGVEAPIRRDKEEEMDDLARAMADNQITAEEKAQWQDQAAVDPNSLTGEAIRDFTGTNPAGYTDTERTRIASTRVSRTPDQVKKKDVEEERRKAEEQERQAEERRASQQRLDDSQFTNDWNSTIRSINESLSELNEQDAKKVKDMTEAAIKMIEQMQNGTLSDEDFTRQMAALENEHANLQREGLEGWQRIKDRLIGDQVNPGGDGRADIQIGGDEADPCVNNFTMTNNSELRCKCQGYTFDNSKARCVKTGGGAGTGSTGGAGGSTGTGNICPCIDEEGRRYRTPFGQPCSFDLGFIDRDYNCSDDTGAGGGSASRTGGSGGGATGRKGMMYRIHTPPYGGGDVCLTAEEAAGIRSAPNTVLFEPLGEHCMK